MFINHHSKQVTAKIVYYGPGLSGKTTNLQYIFSVTNPKTRGELVSIETDIERTLFFDLLPINVGLVNGYQAKFQLYTVPGQVFYDSTRQLVLRGADGIVFVADSQELMENANLESFENLKVNLAKHQQSIEELPVVFQFNKRDLKNILPIDRLNRKLNTLGAPSFGASAITGAGVIETLREISSMTLRKIKGLLAKNIQSQSLEAFVNFDTDRKQKIIKKEELPLKKVSAAAKPVVDSQINISVPAHAPAPTPAPTHAPVGEPKKKPQPVQPLQPQVKKNEECEEVLELTGFEQLEEIRAAQKLEKTDEIPELKGFDVDEIEIELGDSEAPELKGLEDEFEIEEIGPLKTKEKAPQPSGFYELGEIKEPPIIIPARAVKEKAEKEMEKTALEIDTAKISELLKPPGIIPPEMIPTEAKPPKTKPTEIKPPEIKSHEIKPPDVKHPGIKPPEKPKSQDLEFLEKLHDNSRLTIIRKMVLLPGPDSSMVIELKDNKDNTSLLEPIDVKINPGVKKITLILDIK
ncbi:MAG: hypothetical protein QG657_552 [Acidobacteriota bacterium]|nr:hypothetical protein [Acidobacteriota bacterium]